jgi:hypothetical protein
MQHWRRASAGAPAGLVPALLVALLLVAASVGAQDECSMTPTQDSCKNYTVADAVLQRDLSLLCSGSTLGGATYTGWPAACSLWHECQQGRGPPASCQPLTLLQTACNETPEAEGCVT